MKEYIGIDLGATKTKIAIFDEDYELIIENIIPTNVVNGHKKIIKDIADNINLMLNKKGISIESVAYIGIGVAASIDYKTGKLIYANNLTWKDVRLDEEIKVYFDKDVFLVNDACAAALAEQRFGSSKGYKNSVLLTLGSGIGAGIILDDKLFLGGDKSGIELGHMIIDKNGKKCNCGKKGCFESLASVNALIEGFRDNPSVKDSLIMDLCQKDLSKIDGEMIFEAVKKDDILAREILKRYIDNLAIGISNIILLYRPEIVIIGGGISQAGDMLIEPLKERVLEINSVSDFLPVPKIIVARLGNRAGTLGAVLAGQVV